MSESDEDRALEVGGGGPLLEGDAERALVPSPRLDRHVLSLDDGHRVQISVAGRGVPLVVVHGYTAEGLLYAQTLSRLVGSGFKVIAIDTAGHGGTEGLREGAGDLKEYAELLGRIVDHLGIRRAVFAGHSMGGRLVTELVANDPERAIAVLLVDAIVGDTWDSMVGLYRVAPPLMGVTGLTLAVDTISTLPVLADRRQALKLLRLWLPVLTHNVRRPLNLVGAAISILRSGPSRWMLDRLADERVPVVVIHGDRDRAVPLRTARDAARRSRGELVVVHGASHSWVLKDPETLPAIIGELLLDTLGLHLRSALARAGVDFGKPAIAEAERALYEPGALIHDLTPAEVYDSGHPVERQPPRYTWTRSVPRHP
ncbi:MAG TPA: alpha/beta hydrolase [Acidimicrobiales bacterium]|nr:alpha/beta hydrolase [Acidimicrobiales bacterium]